MRREMSAVAVAAEHLARQPEGQKRTATPSGLQVCLRQVSDRSHLGATKIASVAARRAKGKLDETVRDVTNGDRLDAEIGNQHHR